MNLNLQHWRVAEEPSGIAVATLDKAGESANSLSAAVMAELSDMLDALGSDRRFEPDLCRADEVKHPQVPRGRSEGDYAQRHGHPRNVRILPKSRDFH